MLVGATCLLLLNQALKALLPARRPRESGAPRRTLMAGGLAAIVGFFVVPVVGGIPGFVGRSTVPNGCAWAAGRRAGPRSGR